jgi:hypothetical protein
MSNDVSISPFGLPHTESQVRPESTQTEDNGEPAVSALEITQDALASSNEQLTAADAELALAREQLTMANLKLAQLPDVVEANTRAAVAELIATAPATQHKTFITHLNENLEAFVAKVKAVL